MVTYRYLTRREAIEWQANHPIVQGDPLTDMRIDECAFCDMEQPVAAVAFDGDRMVGRNFFVHCPLLVNGRLVECIVTYNLYVHPEYRPKGVGTYIKMHILRMGYPNISSGVSPEMQKVQDAWSAYRKVDSHPVYSVPVDLMGLLRVARIATEDRTSTVGARRGFMATALRQGGRMAALQWGGTPMLRECAPDEAARMLDGVLEAERLPVQLPWNRQLLVDALSGQAAKARAWIVEVQAGAARRQRYLVSAYIKSKVYRTVGDQQSKALELHLNEIFPPVRDTQQGRALFKFALQQARRCGASIVQVYAMTDALREVCVDLGFETFFSKHVYIAPNTKDKALAETLGGAQNWWCRAINEDQFEEVGMPRAGLPVGPALALSIAPRPR